MIKKVINKIGNYPTLLRPDPVLRVLEKVWRRMDGQTRWHRVCAQIQKGRKIWWEEVELGLREDCEGDEVRLPRCVRFHGERETGKEEH